jgi:hypothetical protein
LALAYLGEHLDALLTGSAVGVAGTLTPLASRC